MVPAVNKSNTLTRSSTGGESPGGELANVDEFYTVLSRLFSIRNPNQDTVIRAVAAATVARET